MASSLPSGVNGTLSAFWGFVGAPMAGNVSFIAGFLHWLAIAFKWFLRLLLLLSIVGVVLGFGSLIFGSLPFHIIRRGGKSKPSTDGDTPSSANVVELEFLAADYHAEDDRTSESDDEI